MLLRREKKHDICPRGLLNNDFVFRPFHSFSQQQGAQGTAPIPFHQTSMKVYAGATGDWGKVGDVCQMHWESEEQPKTTNQEEIKGFFRFERKGWDR